MNKTKGHNLYVCLCARRKPWKSLLFSLSLIPLTTDQPHRGLGNQLALDQWDPQDLEPSKGGLWIRTYWALNMNLELDKVIISQQLQTNTTSQLVYIKL